MAPSLSFSAVSDPFASVRSKVIFTPGYNGYTHTFFEIYDVSAQQFLPRVSVSVPRYDIAATTIRNKAIFAGIPSSFPFFCSVADFVVSSSTGGWAGFGFTKQVDIYNDLNGTWSAGTFLSIARTGLTGNFPVLNLL
jgi:hypothetical protein